MKMKTYVTHHNHGSKFTQFAFAYKKSDIGVVNQLTTQITWVICIDFSSKVNKVSETRPL